MIDTVDAFLEQLAARLDQGSRDYGNQSMARSVAAIVDEIRQELLDEVGWTYVLWCIATRKAWGPNPEADLRARFLHELRHRIARNDRGTPDHIPGSGITAAMNDLQVLCMDMFEHAQRVELRLKTLARTVEVSEVVDHYRGRRRGSRDPRSDD